MTVNDANVLAFFSDLTGETCTGEQPRAVLCRELCSQTAEEVREKTGDLPESAAALGEQWAAALAWVRLALADETAGPETVTADGVTVQEGKRSARARELAAEYRRALAPYLGEEGFSFVQA